MIVLINKLLGKNAVYVACDQGINIWRKYEVYLPNVRQVYLPVRSECTWAERVWTMFDTDDICSLKCEAFR